MNRLNQIHVRRSAGTKRLHGQRVYSRFAQVEQEGSREERLAHARVSASDEYDLAHALKDKSFPVKVQGLDVFRV